MKKCVVLEIKDKNNFEIGNKLIKKNEQDFRY